ncbi:MAG: hybrid sensor histidine kinase/response regulator, partial [Sphingobium sp.]
MDDRSDTETRSEKALAARWSLTAEAMEALAGARSLDAVTSVLRAFARRAVGADGIAIVLRDEDKCHYVAEDAMAPLWAGQRFPMQR